MDLSIKAGPLRYKQLSNKLNIRISSQTSILCLIRQLQSSPVQMIPKKENSLKKKKHWHTVGLNKQPFDFMPFAFPSELRLSRFRVGFKADVS